MTGNSDKNPVQYVVTAASVATASYCQNKKRVLGSKL